MTTLYKKVGRRYKPVAEHEHTRPHRADQAVAVPLHPPTEGALKMTIDINKLRQSLGAIQPEEVSELLDRLEAAEQTVQDHLRVDGEKARIAQRLEVAENEIRRLKQTIEAQQLAYREMVKEYQAAANKIAAMERQAPVAKVRVHQIGAGGYRDISTDLTDDAIAAIRMLGIIGTYGTKGAAEMRSLFCDCKTDADKSAFFLSGRAVETGVIAAAISNDVAMAYHRCDEFKKECDALRSLVVMRFDHDYPPQFTQGHNLHELNEPVTAEHCRWFVAEIERLRTDCDALRAKITEMEKQEPVGWFARIDGDGPLMECKHADISRVPLYALPGAQPAPSIPDGWKLVPIVSTHEMKEAGACAGAVHYAIAKDVWSAMLAAAPEAKP